MCRCNGPRHGVRTGVSVSPPQARNFFENITAFLTLLHGSLCRNFYFSQRALLIAQRASSVDKLGGSAAGSLFHAGVHFSLSWQGTACFGVATPIVGIPLHLESTG